MASPDRFSVLERTAIPSHAACRVGTLQQPPAFPLEGTSLLQALIIRTPLTAFVLTKGLTLESMEREVALPSTVEGMRREVAEAGPFQGELRGAWESSTSSRISHPHCVLAQNG